MCGWLLSVVECECLSSVWCWLVALIAVSSVEAGVCMIALVLLLIICKGKVDDGHRELALCLVPEILIWVCYYIRLAFT